MPRITVTLTNEQQDILRRLVALRGKTPGDWIGSWIDKVGSQLPTVVERHASTKEIYDTFVKLKTFLGYDPTPHLVASQLDNPETGVVCNEERVVASLRRKEVRRRSYEKSTKRRGIEY